MVPRLNRELPQFGKIIDRIFFVLSHFLFSTAFFQTKVVHRVFPALGFRRCASAHFVIEIGGLTANPTNMNHHHHTYGSK
jgi:hypothetical protein